MGRRSFLLLALSSSVSIRTKILLLNMVVKDFFHFKEDEYRERISLYDTERLVKQEVVKLRAGIAGGTSIATGAGLAVLTGGASLLASGYGSRRLYVAHKKGKLIEAELLKRGIKPHELNKWDVIIPVGAGLTGMGIGLGVNEIASAATNTAIAGAYVPTGGSALHAVVADPAQALHGAVAGATEQTHEMAFAAHNIDFGIVPGSDMSHEALVSATTWVVNPSAANAVGFHAGMLLAQGVEKALVVHLCQEIAWWIMTAFDSRKKALEILPCRRLAGAAGGLKCDTCSNTFEKGCYWHCCICDDNLDICNKCYTSGRRAKKCKDAKHQLRLHQMAADGDYMATHDVPPAYKQSIAFGSTITIADVNEAYQFGCRECARPIRQGSWFHCNECNSYDICRDCYKSESHCHGSNHSLTLRMCAFDCTKNPLTVSDCRRPLLKSMSCTVCKQPVKQGVYYHCCSCDGDDFDICHSCYKSGNGCHSPERHVLQKHLMGSFTSEDSFPDQCRRNCSTTHMRNGYCTRCNDRFSDSKGQVFYHCCLCAKDNFDICSDCYRSGKGCDDPDHQLSGHLL